VDASTWYLDLDGDGFGETSGNSSLPYLEIQCTQPSGYAPLIGDCNNNDSSVNPNAPEVCDEQDNNCDGLIDDADPNVDVSTGSIFYEDSDSDGYGNPSATTTACQQPPGYVPYSTDQDCNDEDPLLKPGGWSCATTSMTIAAVQSMTMQ
jgi:large repetitive protein